MRVPKLGIPGSRKRALSKESPRVTAILKALHLKGVWAWRVNSSLTVLPKQASHGRRVIKGAPAGSPDILLVLPVRVVGAGRLADADWFAGSLCGLEVKTETGRQSDTQREWQATAEKNGVRYAVVRGVGEALAVVKKWTGNP